MRTLDSTPSSEPSGEEYDVIIVGGGAAGLSAGVFTARYGLDTLVLDRGPSSLRQCYNLENYLGFIGITPEAFLELGRAHARYEGCEIVDDRVRGVHDTDSGFTIDRQEGSQLRSRYVIAASVYDGSYLTDLIDSESDADHPVECDEATGRTDIDGLYVAGWLSGGPHQVIICAGHGARVAKSLIHDYRVREQGFVEELAGYWDWRVEDGTYDDAGWEDHVDAWIDDQLGDREINEDRLARLRDTIKTERLSFCATEEQRKRRLRDARQLLDECVYE